MPKTRSVTKAQDLKIESKSRSVVRTVCSKPGSRPVLPPELVLDPNGDRLLLDIIRECEFIPAVPVPCANPQNEVDQAVDDIISREGDFRVLTCQMIQQQLRLKFTDEIMVQHASRLEGYIRDALSVTIWSSVPEYFRTLKKRKIA